MAELTRCPPYRACLLLRHEKPQVVRRRRHKESGPLMVLSSSGGYSNFTAQDERRSKNAGLNVSSQCSSHTCRGLTWQSLDHALPRLLSVFSIGNSRCHQRPRAGTRPKAIRRSFSRLCGRTLKQIFLLCSDLGTRLDPSLRI